MRAYFVEFLSPGTFVAESTIKPIDDWNVDEAMLMATSIYDRYGARPYAFRFFTRERADSELDIKTGPFTFILDLMDGYDCLDTGKRCLPIQIAMRLAPEQVRRWLDERPVPTL